VNDNAWISQDIVRQGDRTARAGTHNIEADPEQLGITALLGSAHQDLSEASGTPDIINSLSKSQNKSAGRKTSATPYQTRLVENSTVENGRVKLDHNIITAYSSRGVERSHHVNSQTATSTRRDNRARIVRDERMKETISIPQIRRLAGPIQGTVKIRRSIRSGTDHGGGKNSPWRLRV
jgi:hypothetical protein